MGKATGIAWAHSTFNPWWGCWKISPGCKHCYAAAFDHRLGRSDWGKRSPRRFFGESHWNEPLQWNAEAEASGEPWRVFCASMSDWAEDREDLVPHRARLFRLIQATPFLTWLLLSKRPENFGRFLPEHWGAGWSNVWLGVSAENQRWWDRRVPVLQATPAHVRFVSVEPQLAPIFPRPAQLRGIHQVIVGGESGPGARPFAPDWARSLRDVCRGNGAAFFFKQTGSALAGQGKGDEPAAWAQDLRVQEFPEVTRAA